jgi:integrase
MPRKPEIGNVQLYPHRPLRKSDRNGYVLKFYCPIRCTRIRRNCGTRDRREARRIQRECQERLLTGEYLASDGAITAARAPAMPTPPQPTDMASAHGGKSWDECYERYRQNRECRVRDKSLSDALSRVRIAERIFTGYFQDRGRHAGLDIRECCTLEMLEYLQERLLAGDECRNDRRSPNTVNSMMGAVMAFVRYCYQHEWIDRIPAVDKLDVDDVMKGRPVTRAEFERMLEATPQVVGKGVAESWQFALRVLWESGFRVGDLMDFSWDDDRHIHPVWPMRTAVHPTLVIPPSQKNGRVQEIPMLPGLRQLLEEVPNHERQGWIVTPQPIEFRLSSQGDWFQPAADDLRAWSKRFTNCAIATACGVSETTVRNWLRMLRLVRETNSRGYARAVPAAEAVCVRHRAVRQDAHSAARSVDRLTKDHVSRVIAMIGKEAGIVVRQADDRNGASVRHASAHDLRRGCAKRLIDAGVSAETLMVVMRHKSFATTQKFYGAARSAQAAAGEVQEKLSTAQNQALVGGFVGGTDAPAHLSSDDVNKLKQLLRSL